MCTSWPPWNEPETDTFKYIIQPIAAVFRDKKPKFPKVWIGRNLQFVLPTRSIEDSITCEQNLNS